jgi:hypothetical protein
LYGFSCGRPPHLRNCITNLSKLLSHEHIIAYETIPSSTAPHLTNRTRQDVLDRPLVDPGSTYGRSWIDPWSILDSTSGRSWIDLLSRKRGPTIQEMHSAHCKPSSDVLPLHINPVVRTRPNVHEQTIVTSCNDSVCLKKRNVSLLYYSTPPAPLLKCCLC